MEWNAGKVLFLLWLLLSLPWLELWRAKGGPPQSQRLWRQESEVLAGPGDSWPPSGCCREAGACPDIHSVRAEQSKGSSTLVFFPTSRVLPLRALEWELQRPKCELKACSFEKCWFCSFGKASNVPIVEFMGLLASPLDCHVVNWFS